jgi:hypothetical protein
MPPPLTQAPSGRRPAFRGVIMEDISQGKKRVRAWPTKRGPSTNPQQIATQEKFKASQIAAKYISPQQMVDIMAARAGTPLLPRDVVTSIQFNRFAMFILPDGRRWYPMPAYQDVSECLDTITQTEGEMLIRGTNGWEAQPYVPPSGSTGPARAYRNAAATDVTGDGTWWTMAFDTSDLSAPWFSLNAGTGAITISEAGIYTIDLGARFSGATTGDFTGIELSVNGTIVDNWGYDSINQVAFWPRSFSTYTLAAGDVITARARVGGATKIYDVTTGFLATFVKMVRLG